MGRAYKDVADYQTRQASGAGSEQCIAGLVAFA
jgi:hypothetical protein